MRVEAHGFHPSVRPGIPVISSARETLYSTADNIGEPLARRCSCYGSSHPWLALGVQVRDHSSTRASRGAPLYRRGPGGGYGGKSARHQVARRTGSDPAVSAPPDAARHQEVGKTGCQSSASGSTSANPSRPAKSKSSYRLGKVHR